MLHLREKFAPGTGKDHVGGASPVHVELRSTGVLIAALVSFIVLSACRLDMHVQPQQNPLSRSDFFSDQRSERPPVEGTVARGELREDSYLYSGKIGNKPGDFMPFPVTKEVLQRGRERLQHLLRALPLAGGRRQWLRSLSRFLTQAAVLSHRASAEGSGGIFLRCDQQWLRHHARLRFADSASRSLEYRGLHPRFATQPECNQGGRSCRTDFPVGTAAVPPVGFGRDLTRDRAPGAIDT